MGFAYSRHYKQEIKNQAIPTIERAMYYGSLSVRKRGRDYLDMLEKERQVYQNVKPASPGG
jgi:hypothetical protein